MIFSNMISKIAIVNIWLVDICDKYPVRTKIIRIRTEFAIQLQYQEYWADQDLSYMKFRDFGLVIFERFKACIITKRHHDIQRFF